MRVMGQTQHSEALAATLRGETRRPAEMTPVKILIVDDDEDMRATYRRLFSAHADEFSLLEAESIAAGLELLQRESPQCVLLDYMLPDGNGISFIERWQEGRASAGYMDDDRTAIVMVTGQGSESTAAEAMKRGAADYITKSAIDAGLFIRNIRNAIERTQLRNEVAHYQEKLERSYTALSEFTHTASHDLKAPLRHIISYCELIRDEFGEKMGHEGIQYVTRLIVNARRLQRLVDDLLAYSEALDTIEEKTAVNVHEIAQEVLEFLEETARECGATIEVGRLPIVAAYPLRIKQLLQNLVSNALKYRSHDAPVIRVSCEEREADYLFSVEDNGLGIEPEYRDMIFEPFKRLHSRDKVEGSGLGLAICRKIVDMHGGKLWVEPCPSGGSCFYFTIPKAV